MAAAHQETTTRERTRPDAAHPSPMAQTERRSGRAVTAMVLGILSIPLALFIPIVGVIVAILAIILGATARSHAIRNSLANVGQAKAGLICGIVGAVIAVANMIVTAIIIT
jgi:hypothetical protein